MESQPLHMVQKLMDLKLSLGELEGKVSELQGQIQTVQEQLANVTQPDSTEHDPYSGPWYVGKHTLDDLPQVGEKPWKEGTISGYEYSDRAPCAGYTFTHIWWDPEEGKWMQCHPTDDHRGPIPAPEGVKIRLVVRY